MRFSLVAILLLLSACAHGPGGHHGSVYSSGTAVAAPPAAQIVKATRIADRPSRRVYAPRAAMWHPAVSKEMSVVEATLYCASLPPSSGVAWRVPTRKQLSKAPLIRLRLPYNSALWSRDVPDKRPGYRWTVNSSSRRPSMTPEDAVLGMRVLCTTGTPVRGVRLRTPRFNKDKAVDTGVLAQAKQASTETKTATATTVGVAGRSPVDRTVKLPASDSIIIEELPTDTYGSGFAAPF